MNPINDGGPAFPAVESVDEYGGKGDLNPGGRNAVYIESSGGMSYRAYVAAGVLPEMVVQLRHHPVFMATHSEGENAAECARLAVLAADALIAELSKGSK